MTTPPSATASVTSAATGPLLLGLLLLASFSLRGSAVGPLPSTEGLYLCSSPLPLFLTLLLPGAVPMASAEGVATRRWNDRLSSTGITLSGLLVPTGLWLLWRRNLRRQRVDRWLTAGLFVASAPLLMLLILILLYLPRR